MNIADFHHWQAANQAYLAASLAIVHHALARYVAQIQGQPEPEESLPDLQAALQQAAAALPGTSALETLCRVFHLSPFERDLLLLCVGLELDSRFMALCSSAQERRPYATFNLALAALPGAHWNALAPTAPLRYWPLIEVNQQEILTLSPLRVDERILHYLTGTSYPDTRLRGLIEAVPVPEALPPSQQRLVDRITQLWSRQQPEATWTAVQLCGPDTPDKIAIAAMACAQLGLRLQVLRAAELSASLAEREALIPLWEREARLTNSALLLDCEELDRAETGRAVWVVERLPGLLLVASREPLHLRERMLLRLDVTKPSATEQQDLWQTELGPLAAEMNGQIAALVMQFNLSPQAIRAACLDFQVQTESSPEAVQDHPLKAQSSLLRSLWDACRSQSRPRLEELAQRIEPAATWEELVLPDLQKQTLREISAHVRQRAKVYDTWGFSSKGARGLGISVLFAGMSGTGKTMAAEVLAQELRLDLYRIDLSSVVSKYIGETEKNLRRVFDAAETGGAILLFDEADALFGKRSEVKDSHDRYANIEVSYLLQRMEAYRGLAILTTNLKEALDTAFLRRIRFVVQFPFPDAAQRTEIWRRIFPAATPREGLDVDRLGRLNVAGGNIRNIALNAAFLAADAGEKVQMKHLRLAAQSEYTKLEKSLTDAEVRDWV
jgi:SpoVK/Ycf46/Vps4 family AAA+-type ATPase